MDNIYTTTYFKKLDERAKEPTQGSKQSAGFDLYALEDVFIKKGSTVKVRTGISLDIPNNTFVKIEDRSSLAAKGIRSGAGIVDSDYTGEIIVVLHNLFNYDDFSSVDGGLGYKVNAGDKIAQMILLPVVPTILREVNILDKNTSRGSNGFGSTGR